MYILKTVHPMIMLIFGFILRDGKAGCQAVFVSNFGYFFNIFSPVF